MTTHDNPSKNAMFSPTFASPFCFSVLPGSSCLFSFSLPFPPLPGASAPPPGRLFLYVSIKLHVAHGLTAKIILVIVTILVARNVLLHNYFQAPKLGTSAPNNTQLFRLLSLRFFLRYWLWSGGLIALPELGNRRRSST